VKLIQSIYGPALLLVATSANAEAYLQGRFELKMSESKFKGDAPMTGGLWVFENDDGKTRTGYLVQYLKNGRPQVFYYGKTPYDGKLYWLNDWYMESNKIIDQNNFSVGYEVRKETMKEPIVGTASCKINETRTKFVCDVGGSIEVYEKSS
jgi:hypothetical protein